jgi:hypothetical protein
MKTVKQIFEWCIITAMMLPIVAVVLTFVSCEKDDGSNAPPPASVALDTITFEDVKQALLAGPTAYGENLYYGYSGQYTGYQDAATGLWMKINPTGMWSSDTNFFNGGIAISRWNDTTMAGDSNQCSVYYIDPNTGYGGHNGSETFAVHYGYIDTITSPDYSIGDARSYITFDNTSKTCVFDHFYVSNSTYAFRAMRDGYFVASPLQPDSGWLKLVIDGIAPNGTVTGTVEFYLADFRTSTSPGILEGWHRVDLNTLGSVTAIRFDIQGSDTGDYGLNTPAYFCFDDLVVQLN